MHPYYAAKTDSLLADFRAAVSQAATEFEVLLGAGRLEDLAGRIEASYREVIAQLPYVGGDEGRMTPFFERGLSLVALGRVLRAEGVGTAQIGRLTKAVFRGYFVSIPEAGRRQLGTDFLSAGNRAVLEREAGRSQTREHLEDFVYSIVEAGEGEDFDLGIDYHECGLSKFCHKHGDLDLLPHICAVDFDAYALRSVGLERKTTLASGAERCDFRFKAGS